MSTKGGGGVKSERGDKAEAVRSVFGGEFDQIPLVYENKQLLYTPPDKFVGTTADYYIAGNGTSLRSHLVEGAEYREVVLDNSKGGYEAEDHRPYTLCNQTNAADEDPEFDDVHRHFFEWLLSNARNSNQQFPNTEALINQPKRIALRSIPSTPCGELKSSLCGNCARIYTGMSEIKPAMETGQQISTMLPDETDNYE